MFSREYKRKIPYPEEAVKVVKSGDWIDYMYFNGYPKALDKALAKRKIVYGVHIVAASPCLHFQKYLLVIRLWSIFNGTAGTIAPGMLN